METCAKVLNLKPTSILKTWLERSKTLDTPSVAELSRGEMKLVSPSCQQEESTQR